jgi:uncharacterized membrane protein YcaP (DUF421 family)
MHAMDSVVRAALTYATIWLIFRISGKRTLSQITTFDFVLLLIISETTQSALAADDKSMTNSLLLFLTFFVIDIGLSLFKNKFRQAESVVDGEPLMILAHGRPIAAHLNKERVNEEDILAAARQNHGIGRLEEIEYAILECDGEISVIPKNGREPSAK